MFQTNLIDTITNSDESQDLQKLVSQDIKTNGSQNG